MKCIGVLILVASLNAISQEEPQVSVSEIKTYTSEAKDLINSFDLKDEVAPVGAPDYSLAKKLLLHNINKKGHKLEHDLKVLEQRLTPSYNLIKGIEDLDKSKAKKATLKEAKLRFADKVAKENGAYHSMVAEYILHDLDPAIKACLTVLCANKIKVDIQKWIDHASKINKNINVDYATLKSYPKNEVKRSRDWINGEAERAMKNLELAITKGDPRCENLNDDVSVENLLKFGTQLIASTKGGVKGILKNQELERLRIEEEARLKKEKDLAAALAWYNDEINKKHAEDLERFLSNPKLSTNYSIIKALEDSSNSTGCMIRFVPKDYSDDLLFELVYRGKKMQEFNGFGAGMEPAQFSKWIKDECRAKDPRVKK